MPVVINRRHQTTSLKSAIIDSPYPHPSYRIFVYNKGMLNIYFISLLIILFLSTLVFFLAIKKKDNSIVDIAYGLFFILTAYTLTYLKVQVAPLSTYTVAILLFITIWGLRLSYRIYKKNKGKEEDFRYKAWREEWMKEGTWYFLIRSHLQIFMLQGFIVSIVLLPFTLSLLGIPVNETLLNAGSIIWLIGFLFESIGDYQLDRFVRQKHVHGQTIMKTGLWKYTRHPNYFGEAMMWWGVALIGYGASTSILVFLSPILITYLLLYVSGIPMLEKKWSGEEWEDYKRRTSAFIPLPPKK
jgi:steroid 5-alpha reductase family enzyme